MLQLIAVKKCLILENKIYNTLKSANKQINLWHIFMATYNSHLNYFCFLEI